MSTLAADTRIEVIEGTIVGPFVFSGCLTSVWEQLVKDRQGICDDYPTEHELDAEHPLHVSYYAGLFDPDGAQE